MPHVQSTVLVEFHQFKIHLTEEMLSQNPVRLFPLYASPFSRITSTSEVPSCAGDGVTFTPAAVSAEILDSAVP